MSVKGTDPSGSRPISTTFMRSAQSFPRSNSCSSSRSRIRALCGCDFDTPTEAHTRVGSQTIEVIKHRAIAALCSTDSLRSSGLSLAIGGAIGASFLEIQSGQGRASESRLSRFPTTSHARGSPIMFLPLAFGVSPMTAFPQRPALQTAMDVLFSVACVSGAACGVVF